MDPLPSIALAARGRDREPIRPGSLVEENGLRADQVGLLDEFGDTFESADALLSRKVDIPRYNPSATGQSVTPGIGR